jgi:hypothetical protein
VVPITSATGTASLILNDQGTAAGRTFPVDAGSVAWSVGSVGGVTYSGLQGVAVHGGGGTTWFVEGTAAGVNTTIDGGGGVPSAPDGFVIEAYNNALLGPLALHETPGGNSFMEYDDYLNATPQTYTLTADTMSRSGLAPVTYDNLNEVILYPAAVGGNAINVPSLAAGVLANLEVAGGDTVTLGANQAVASVLGTVAVGPVNDNISANVVIDDSADTTPPAGRITFSNDPPTYSLAITGVVPGGIYFAAGQNTILNTSLSMGAGDKTFNVQTAAPGVALTLDGGSGTNTLDYTGYAGNVLVDLPLGTATGLSHISDIQNVTGASGGGAGFYNVLVGNGGNVLTGGFGRRNILVAGGSASTLIGGDQDDLLIGGTTAYDTEPGLASWQAIGAYWAGPDGYWTRMSNLLAGNGVPLLDATTVTGNGGGNTINGNGALALIYTDGLDNISGFDPASQSVPITP